MPEARFRLDGRVTVPLLGLLFVAYAVLFGVLLHRHGRHDAVVLDAVAIALFAPLLLALRAVRWTPRTVLFVVLAGTVVLQLIAITTRPTTSSDVYRYLWDGRVQFAGIDPYRYAPQAPQLAHLRDPYLFPHETVCRWHIPDGCTRINRPAVRTIYPPIAQLVFDLARAVSFGGHGGVSVFQLLAALGVLAVAALLARTLLRRGEPVWPAAAWGWSPLVVIEYGNNAHLDWVGVLLAVLCLAAARSGRAAWTGVLLAAATLTKIYPAAVGPAVLKRRPWLVLGSAAAVVVLAYLPHVLAVGGNVIGYLPGYLNEEGYDSGDRLLLLGAVLPHPLDSIAAVVILAALTVWTWWRSDPAAPERSAVVLMGVALLVATPKYGWYAGLLIALAVLARRLEWLPVALAPGLVYVLRLYVSHALWISRTPFAVAALVVLVAAVARRSRGARPSDQAGRTARVTPDAAVRRAT